MSWKTLIAVTCFVVVAPFTHADDLVGQTQQAHQQASEHNQAREAQFAMTERELREKLNQLKATRNALEAETEKLSDTFSDNEQQLASLEDKLRLESGSLGELFGVVRQASKTIQTDGASSYVAITQPAFNQTVADIVAADTLPSLKQLNSLWQGMLTQMQTSGELQALSLPVVNAQGVSAEQSVVRVGNLGLVNEQGYLNWQSARQVAVPYRAQPDETLTSAKLEQAITNVGETVLVDPSRGFLLGQLENAPSLSDRFAQGGFVAKVIAALLTVGLLIALYRGAVLLSIHAKMHRQLKHPESPEDNPLGRVLKVYHDAPKRDVESLELRLLEAVVDEQQGCEKGLSMLKLLAALAPMLGLLGTVTGMIETFQVITQFGNGDPKVMADGISMALVTTVLGLIAAIPLLLAHNILSGQADHIRGMLEKQSISLVAEQAENSDQRAETGQAA
ncbi:MULTISPECIES: MotA/TolQ/ExbB proton channel family protein [Salinivibrio]|uniref:Flagellar motor protein MotA n=1 Tax=Salinivibrio siamensis TaxID=414286 RepID=A0ABX3K9E7_9GAMM|nr:MULTISPECIES: MotA/TolQ/ExbB proton channel family protein [Salinivibrio]KKA43504.1 flagellar motor protein MotA [Salinivibrio sp. KP-1]OOE67695.1 flagellar motor protein MotA [Salinivibrio sp. IB868]OOE74009.1 flagellar motor protein MotA [Salinivibrio sp. IB870]OOE85558.1 flagellar motor protein MotA [Salinivibrio siamensis]